MPYLIGPNRAPIRPNRNSATNSNGSEFSWKPATAMPAAPISANFSRRATSALSKRSASSPPKADAKKNGAIKMPPANVTKDSPDWPAILNRISKASVFFRKLSLKAEKNWHQNSGAKRREVRSDCDIDLSRDCRRVTCHPRESGWEELCVGLHHGRACFETRSSSAPQHEVQRAFDSFTRSSRGDDNRSRLSFRNVHQQALGLGVLDPAHQL